MTDIKRSNLDWARDIARSYRSALHAVDPERCAQLDEVARKRGQRWLAPTEIPAHLVDDALDAEMSAIDIEHFWGVPSSTIRGWARRGLLNQYCAPDGAPRYKAREVVDCQTRHQVRASGRHDIAVAGQ